MLHGFLYYLIGLPLAGHFIFHQLYNPRKYQDKDQQGVEWEWCWLKAALLSIVWPIGLFFVVCRIKK